MTEQRYEAGQTQDFREPRTYMRPGVASMNTIAGHIAEFVHQWRKGPMNGDEIYTLNYMTDSAFPENREPTSVTLRASELHELLEERNYDRNLIHRLERAYPQIADELKLHAP